MPQGTCVFCLVFACLLVVLAKLGDTLYCCPKFCCPKFCAVFLCSAFANNGLVNNTRGMFWSNRGLYSNKSTDLAEISASLCVVQLMHNRSPPCATICLQLHLVLSRWPKGSALWHHT